MLDSGMFPRWKTLLRLVFVSSDLRVAVSPKDETGRYDHSGATNAVLWYENMNQFY